MAGRRIDDHSAWMGKGMTEKHILPIGVHTKIESSDGHAGDLSVYEDTTEKIRAQQEMGVRKVKGHPRKELQRN